jgi:hypothetical protein
MRRKTNRRDEARPGGVDNGEPQWKLFVAALQRAIGFRYPAKGAVAGMRAEITRDVGQLRIGQHGSEPRHIRPACPSRLGRPCRIIWIASRDEGAFTAELNASDGAPPRVIGASGPWHPSCASKGRIVTGDGGLCLRHRRATRHHRCEIDCHRERPIPAQRRALASPPPSVRPLRHAPWKSGCADRR